MKMTKFSNCQKKKEQQLSLRIKKVIDKQYYLVRQLYDLCSGRFRKRHVLWTNVCRTKPRFAINRL